MKCRASRRFALALMLCAFATPAHAADAAPSAVDPELEARVQNVAAELRCLVCQNQTIADSNAPLAVDLRGEVRAMLSRGSSELEVREFMVTRYGDFILYRPPIKATTLVLWGGPFVLLIGGLLILKRLLKSRNTELVEAPLNAEEQARLAALLASRQGPERG